VNFGTTKDEHSVDFFKYFLKTAVSGLESTYRLPVPRVDSLGFWCWCWCPCLLRISRFTTGAGLLRESRLAPNSGQTAVCTELCVMQHVKEPRSKLELRMRQVPVPDYM
jgi:hypothetical protein